jgi:hypothetical protein
MIVSSSTAVHIRVYACVRESMHACAYECMRSEVYMHVHVDTYTHNFQRQVYTFLGVPQKYNRDAHANMHAY